MKKILLSAAVLAASGAYVAYANHAATDPLAAAGLATAVRTGGDIIPPVKAEPTAVTLDPAAVVPPASMVVVMPPAPEGPRPVHTIAIVAADVPSQPTPPSAAVPGVPLPRRRPTLAVPAASTSTTQVARYRDGTYDGVDASAYYGRVKVAVVIQGGRISAVNVLDYPSDRRTSRYINGQALPALEQEVIQAQSAQIDLVSGATLTSEAYVQSLDAALSAAASGGNA